MTSYDLDTYWNTGFHQVEGWVASALLPCLKSIAVAQDGAKLAGNVAEIGVFRRKLPIALAHMARTEKCLAIDLFDDQVKNIDGSGEGSLSPLENNWQLYAPPSCKLIAFPADSLALTLSRRVLISQHHGPFKLFSIDRGHTVEHVVNDLLIAQDMLADGGVMIYFTATGPA